MAAAMANESKGRVTVEEGSVAAGRPAAAMVGMMVMAATLMAEVDAVLAPVAAQVRVAMAGARIATCPPEAIRC